MPELLARRLLNRTHGHTSALYIAPTIADVTCLGIYNWVQWKEAVEKIESLPKLQAKRMRRLIVGLASEIILGRADDVYPL